MIFSFPPHILFETRDARHTVAEEIKRYSLFY